MLYRILYYVKSTKRDVKTEVCKCPKESFSYLHGVEYFDIYIDSPYKCNMNNNCLSLAKSDVLAVLSTVYRSVCVLKAAIVLCLHSSYHSAIRECGCGLVTSDWTEAQRQRIVKHTV